MKIHHTIVRKKNTAPSPEKVIGAAQNMYANNDDVQIDDNPTLTRSDKGRGTWVAAWVWLSDEEVRVWVS